MLIANPEKFTAWFNTSYPDACRRITPEDIIEMTACGLIHRYRYYCESTTVRGVLPYEQMREKRIGRDEAKVFNIQPTCKGCGQPLPALQFTYLTQLGRQALFLLCAMVMHNEHSFCGTSSSSKVANLSWSRH